MYFIEAIKNLHSYLFLGRCRRHDRELSVVQVDGHYASTMPVCIECHPHYAPRHSAKLELKRPIAIEHVEAASLDLAEVEVG